MFSHQIKTASDLKAFVESSGNCPYFFDRKTMKFFGDTMRNYGVRGPVDVETYSQGVVKCWELYRRHPVKHGLQDSAYFDCETFARVHAKK